MCSEEHIYKWDVLLQDHFEDHLCGNKFLWAETKICPVGCPLLLNILNSTVVVTFSSEKNYFLCTLFSFGATSLWVICLIWLPWWLSGKEPACQCRRCAWEDPLEKEMATQYWQPSSILVWEIPWTEEPGRPVYGVAKQSDMFKD